MEWGLITSVRIQQKTILNFENPPIPEHLSPQKVKVGITQKLQL